METQFYVHCLPEICTDPPKNSTDLKFYNQFKSCHNISHPCNLDPSVHPNDLSNDNKYSSESKDTATSIAIGPSNCYSKLGKGPVIINDNGQQAYGPGADASGASIPSGSRTLLFTLSALLLLYLV